MSLPTRPDDASALLRDARTHADHAREHLDAAHTTVPDALDDVLASFRASLLAHLAWYGADSNPDAPLATLAERAIHCDSILKTPVQRAMQLSRRAPAIRAATHPTVNDREDVETGWFTARNLLWTVSGRIA
jgi:hypothetical protein